MSKIKILLTALLLLSSLTFVNANSGETVKTETAKESTKKTEIVTKTTSTLNKSKNELKNMETSLDSLKKELDTLETKLDAYKTDTFVFNEELKIKSTEEEIVIKKKEISNYEKNIKESKINITNLEKTVAREKDVYKKNNESTNDILSSSNNLNKISEIDKKIEKLPKEEDRTDEQNLELAKLESQKEKLSDELGKTYNDSVDNLKKANSVINDNQILLNSITDKEEELTKKGGSLSADDKALKKQYEEKIAQAKQDKEIYEKTKKSVEENYLEHQKNEAINNIQSEIDTLVARKKDIDNNDNLTDDQKLDLKKSLNNQIKSLKDEKSNIGKATTPEEVNETVNNASTISREAKNAIRNQECSNSGNCVDKDTFKLKIGTFSPIGSSLTKENQSTQELVNNTLGTIIQKLMIALGSLSLLIMSVGAGYMILYHGQDEILSKGKAIFKGGVIALVVALSSYYLVALLRFLLYNS